MSLFMTMINLLASLLRSSARVSAPAASRRSPRGSGGALGAGGVALLVIAAFVALAAAPRATFMLGLVVLVVFLARRFFGGPKTPSAQALAQRLEAPRAMSGPQFELFVADLLRAMGYKTTVLGGSGDQGVDLIVDYQGERVAVQCKNYGNPVGNKPVQEVYVGARHHGCTRAWVVAPAGFTKGAVELARSVGVSLYDAPALREWIRQIDRRERAIKESTPANLKRRPVDLDAESTEKKEDTVTDWNMEKHTISVGTDTIGETVRFTAKELGTAQVNGGKRGRGWDGLDVLPPAG